MKVQGTKELKNSNEFKIATQTLAKLSKPEQPLVDALNQIEYIGDMANKDLQNLLGIFTAWQNYYAEKLVKVDVLRTVAESQLNYFSGVAITEASGSNVTEKKEKAKLDNDYLNSKKVYDTIRALYKATEALFWNCDRAYKLVSRVLTGRLSTIIE